MDHQTVGINWRALRRLRKHMRKHHPQELDHMIKCDPTGKLNDVAFAGRSGGELATLNYACYEPTLFPVHVLADDTVFALIQKVQRGTLASLWLSAVYHAWGLWK